MVCFLTIGQNNLHCITILFADFYYRRIITIDSISQANQFDRNIELPYQNDKWAICGFGILAYPASTLSRFHFRELWFFCFHIVTIGQTIAKQTIRACRMLRSD
uniref:(northern house mosquito) hypothetical protein n=1 Tax=Culex pipiens TaxID=7175 RepID=A0A8D8FBK4_CULPI